MIWLPRFGIEIRTSPKVLSTSLKSMAFRLENDRDFEPYTRQGRRVPNVHKVYPAKPFDAHAAPSADYRVAFVRDPVDRFISFYKNRVLRRHGHEAEYWAWLDDTPYSKTPSLQELVEHLDDYRRLVRPVHHHTERQVVFLGDEPTYYDFIFNPRQVGEFEQLMSHWTGSSVQLPHEQRSGGVRPHLAQTEVTLLHQFFADDYVAYGDWF